MHRVEPLRLGFRHVDATDGTNLESLLLDALDDPAREPSLHGVGLDDSQRSFEHPLIIAAANLNHFSAAEPREETFVTTMTTKQQDDPDAQKGATEGNQPSDKQPGNPNGDGLDENGLPNDPIATAEDRIGANEDESQG